MIKTNVNVSKSHGCRLVLHPDGLVETQKFRAVAPQGGGV